MTPSFSGRWFTTYGPMPLEQLGARVVGTYGYAGGEGRIEGRVHGSRLRFVYEEPGERGTGEFRRLRGGRFVGSYRAEGASASRRWEGHRGWDGLWESDFGRIRLTQDGAQVSGTYAGPGGASLAGRANGDVFTFRYRERNATGEGRFRLAAEGDRFEGEWRPRGRRAWKPWNGRRAQATPGLTWLVVFEAHWQRGLGEPEYSYGGMVREVFARLPSVRIRHRFFHDAESLEHWCAELAFLPEPAIVLLASHGLPGGLTVHGELIDTRRVLKALAAVENLRLLHFSSCLVGNDATRTMRGQPWPVSGYTTSVDWGASALLEFTYLDLMLNRGLSPADAAAKLCKLVPYAGDRAPRGSPYAAAGFRFFAPG